MKEHRQLEENWKRRWSEMNRKRKREEEVMVERAEQARRNTEEYWSRKEEQERERQRNIASRVKGTISSYDPSVYPPNQTPLRMMDSSHPIMEEGVRHGHYI